MVYRTDLFEKSGLEIPTTLEEFVEAGKTLQADNADVPNFSGIYFPGRNWHAMLSFIWDSGGDIAVQEDGQWVGQLGSDESVAGLEFFYPRIAPGGYLILDDYNNSESGWAVSRAVKEFMVDKPEGVIELADMWGSVVFRRAGTTAAKGQV